MGRIKERGPIKDRRIFKNQLIDLFVDLPLGPAGVLGGHMREEPDVVVDKRFPRHGKLGAVGFQLPVRKHVGLERAVFQLAAFRNLVKITAAQNIVVIFGELEICQGSPAGPALKGARDMGILLNDRLFDRVVQNGGKIRRRREELPDCGVPQVCAGAAQKLCRAALSAAGHALNQQVAHGHSPHLLRALGGRVHLYARLKQKRVPGGVAEAVRPRVPRPGPYRRTVLN